MGFFTSLFQSLLSLVKVVVQSKPGLHVPIAQKGSSCAVLGNGPSLAGSLANHSEFFLQTPSFAVNNFATSGAFLQVKPTYYALLDPNYWSKDREAFQKYGLQKLLDALAERTTWPLHLLLPVAAKGVSHFAELTAKNPNIRIHHFNYTVYRGFESLGFWLFKRGLAMPQAQNVLVASLFLAINCGFKTIYVFGADHNWHETLHVDDENRLMVKHHHFYDNKAEVRLTPFHKTPDALFSMAEIFEAWARVFRGHEAIARYAKQREVSVFNASGTGFVDAYERINLEN